MSPLCQSNCRSELIDRQVDGSKLWNYKAFDASCCLNMERSCRQDHLNYSPSTQNSRCGSNEIQITSLEAKNEEAEKEQIKQQYKNYYKFQSERDFLAFWRSMEILHHSCWFHHDMDREAARATLERRPVGAFLMRTSASPSHVFTLSLQLPSGPVSCRLNYRRGLFKLDSVSDDESNPWFENVVQLVEWYVRSTQRDSVRGGLSFVMGRGERKKRGTAKLVIPCLRSVPTLAHCARLAVNRALRDFHLPQVSVDPLPVPERIKTFLKEYPYIV